MAGSAGAYLYPGGRPMHPIRDPDGGGGRAFTPGQVVAVAGRERQCARGRHGQVVVIHVHSSDS